RRGPPAPDPRRCVPHPDRTRHRPRAERRPGQRCDREGDCLMTSFSSALVDGFVVAKRNLIKVKRVSEMLVLVLLSPIMFVLLFAYVFGGLLHLPGVVNLREFRIGW